MTFPIYQTGNSFQSNSSEAIALTSKSSIGEIHQGKVIYSIYEVLYLIDEKKAELIKGNSKIKFEQLLKKVKPNTYFAFKDLRDKGNILKEGLKFGADFRVYEKGEKPGKAHAKYLLYVADSSKKLELRDFAAKARIAHSTNKILLLAVVDSERDISYYEVKWKSK